MATAWVIAWLIHGMGHPPEWWMVPTLICLALLCIIEMVAEFAFTAEVIFNVFDKISDRVFNRK